MTALRLARLDIEPVQAGAPAQVQVGCAGAGPPQPQRPGNRAAVRQPGDGDADQVASDDGRFPEAGEPAPAEQFRVQPGPGPDADLPVPFVPHGQLLFRGVPGGPFLALQPAGPLPVRARAPPLSRTPSLPPTPFPPHPTPPNP